MEFTNFLLTVADDAAFCCILVSAPVSLDFRFLLGDFNLSIFAKPSILCDEAGL